MQNSSTIILTEANQNGRDKETFEHWARVVASKSEKYGGGFDCHLTGKGFEYACQQYYSSIGIQRIAPYIECYRDKDYFPDDWWFVGNAPFPVEYKLLKLRDNTFWGYRHHWNAVYVFGECVSRKAPFNEYRILGWQTHDVIKNLKPLDWDYDCRSIQDIPEDARVKMSIPKLNTGPIPDSVFEPFEWLGQDAWNRVQKWVTNKLRHDNRVYRRECLKHDKEIQEKHNARSV